MQMYPQINSTYENPTYQKNIQYPADWIANTTLRTTVGSPDIASFSPPQNDLVTVYLVKYAHALGKPSMTLQEYLDAVINSRKGTTGFKVLQASTDATLSNQSAYLLVATEGSGDTAFEARKVGTIVRNDVYLVRYIADTPEYYTFLPTADKMVDSFTIAATPNSQ